MRKIKNSIKRRLKKVSEEDLRSIKRWSDLSEKRMLKKTNKQLKNVEL